MQETMPAKLASTNQFLWICVPWWCLLTLAPMYITNLSRCLFLCSVLISHGRGRAGESERQVRRGAGERNNCEPSGWENWWNNLCKESSVVGMAGRLLGWEKERDESTGPTCSAQFCTAQPTQTSIDSRLQEESGWLLKLHCTV